MLNHTEFRDKALAHYQGKLASEKARFGVKAISNEFVENNARILVGSDLWDDLTKQMGLKSVVSYGPDGDVQTVYMIVSDHEIQRPGQLYELWRIVNRLVRQTDQDEHERLRHDIGLLHRYDGPYKLDVPEHL